MCCVRDEVMDTLRCSLNSLEDYPLDYADSKNSYWNKMVDQLII